MESVSYILAQRGKERGIPNVIELETSLGILMFDGTEKMFAIDGQHRIAAIQKTHRQFPRAIGTDQYPVIFVAHVDDSNGKVRTRRLFSDINKNAVPVSGGDKVVIDEDDLCAIVTRRVYAEDPLFNGGDEIAVSGKKEHLTEEGRERFTSLLAIYTVTKCLKQIFRKRKGTLDNDPQNIQQFQQIVSRFFDFAADNEPSLNRYFRLHTTTAQAERINNRSLFFRPVGLEMLARLYAYFKTRNHLSILAEGLKRLQLENPGGILDGVLWSQGRIESSAKARNCAVKLCLYLLHELDPLEESALERSLQEVTKNIAYRLPPKPSISNVSTGQTTKLIRRRLIKK